MRLSWWAGLAATLALAALLAAAPGALAAEYTVQTFGRTATAINNSGDVTGTFDSPLLGDIAPYRYSNGQLVDLSGLLDRAISGDATGINNVGDIVGTQVTVDFLRLQYLLRGTTLVPDLVGERGRAWDVNDAGEVAGAGFFLGDTHAFLWRDGVARDLGTLGGHDSIAFATQKLGQAAGEAQLADGRTHAFLSTSGHMRDLGTLGGRGSQAEDVNAQNHVVGTAQLPSGGGRAFLWTPARGMRSLGQLARRRVSAALAVNALDEVVGRSNVPGGAHAFRWTASTGMVDLNTLIPPVAGLTLVEATGVNRSGQIVGNGLLDGRQTGFLLTPA